MRRGSPGAATAALARTTLRTRAIAENFMAGYLKPLGLPRQPETAAASEVSLLYSLPETGARVVSLTPRISGDLRRRDAQAPENPAQRPSQRPRSRRR